MPGRCGDLQRAADAVVVGDGDEVHAALRGPDGRLPSARRNIPAPQCGAETIRWVGRSACCGRECRPWDSCGLNTGFSCLPWSPDIGPIIIALRKTFVSIWRGLC